jgi:hypothetical protein
MFLTTACPSIFLWLPYVLCSLFYFSILYFAAAEYMNAEFVDGVLLHGKQYIVCVHAPEVIMAYEKWSETLPEVSTCSDGVTVDLTAPSPGKVWIGRDIGTSYQVRVVNTTQCKVQYKVDTKYIHCNCKSET